MERDAIVVFEQASEKSLTQILTQNKNRGHGITRKPLIFMVPRDGIEPPTRGFSVPCSTD
jgi:hypothetical protein